MSSPAAWTQCLDIEKRLRNELRKHSFWAPEIRRLRGALAAAYDNLLFSHYAFAQTHEAEQAMWKSVFYRPIEEFRSHTKDLTSKLQHLAAASGSSAPGGEADEMRSQLSKLTGAYLKFLDEAALAYKRLIWKLQWVFGSVGAKVELDASIQNDIKQSVPRKAGEDAAAGVTDVRGSCHRCLVFLGDLSRYQSQAMKGAKPEWQRAVSFYRSAVFVLPANGNPHNQLAVMAYYVGDELRAVYCYFRALAVQQPFVTARENLLLLFERNRGGYHQIAARHAAAALAGGGPNHSAAQAGADVATRWVRLHGLLFDRINMEQFADVLRHALVDLDKYLGDASCLDMLQRSAAHDHLLLQLATLCIYSAWAAEGKPPGGKATTGTARPSYQDVAQRGTMRRLAGRVAAEFGTRVMAAAANMKAGDPGFSAVWVSAHVMASWLLVTPGAWPVPPTSDAPEDDDVAARTRLWRAAAGLALCAGRAVVARQPSEPPLVVLPEDVELTGFEPLRSIEATAKAESWPRVTSDGEVTGRTARLWHALRSIARQWGAAGADPAAVEAARAVAGAAMSGAVTAGAVREHQRARSEFLAAVRAAAEPVVAEGAAGAAPSSGDRHAHGPHPRTPHQAVPVAAGGATAGAAAPADPAANSQHDDVMEDGEQIVYQPTARRITPTGSGSDLAAAHANGCSAPGVNGATLQVDGPQQQATLGSRAGGVTSQAPSRGSAGSGGGSGSGTGRASPILDHSAAPLWSGVPPTAAAPGSNQLQTGGNGHGGAPPHGVPAAGAWAPSGMMDVSGGGVKNGGVGTDPAVMAAFLSIQHRSAAAVPLQFTPPPVSLPPITNGLLAAATAGAHHPATGGAYRSGVYDRAPPLQERGAAAPQQFPAAGALGLGAAGGVGLTGPSFPYGAAGMPAGNASAPLYNAHGPANNMLTPGFGSSNAAVPTAPPSSHLHLFGSSASARQALPVAGMFNQSWQGAAAHGVSPNSMGCPGLGTAGNAALGGLSTMGFNGLGPAGPVVSHMALQPGAGFAGGGEYGVQPQHPYSGAAAVGGGPGVAQLFGGGALPNTASLAYAADHAANRDIENIAVSVVDTVLNGSNSETLTDNGGGGRSGGGGGGGQVYSQRSGGAASLFGNAAGIGGASGGSVGFGLGGGTINAGAKSFAQPVWQPGDSTAALSQGGGGGGGSSMGDGVESHSFADYFANQHQQIQQQQQQQAWGAVGPNNTPGWLGASTHDTLMTPADGSNNPLALPQDDVWSIGQQLGMGPSLFRQNGLG